MLSAGEWVRGTSPHLSSSLLSCPPLLYGYSMAHVADWCTQCCCGHIHTDVSVLNLREATRDHMSLLVALTRRPGSDGSVTIASPSPTGAAVAGKRPPGEPAGSFHSGVMAVSARLRAQAVLVVAHEAQPPHPWMLKQRSPRPLTFCLEVGVTWQPRRPGCGLP